MNSFVEGVRMLLALLKSPKLLLVGFFVCLGLLLLPPNLVNELQLEQFTRYRGYVVLLCLVFGVAILVELVWWIAHGIALRAKRARLKREGKRYLHRLSPAEKHIMSLYIERETGTLNLRPHDGNVAVLESMGLIYRASNLGEFPTLPFNIEPWVRVYLLTHIYLIRGELSG